MRHDIDPMDMDDLLLHRKEIYEALYPETRARNLPGHASNYKSSTDLKSVEVPKPFADDTAEKMGITAHQVRRKIQIAQHLTPETKKIVKENGISEISSLKLARIKEPEKQKEVAEKLARHEIKTVEKERPHLWGWPCDLNRRKKPCKMQGYFYEAVHCREITLSQNGGSKSSSLQGK